MDFYDYLKKQGSNQQNTNNEDFYSYMKKQSGTKAQETPAPSTAPAPVTAEIPQVEQPKKKSAWANFWETLGNVIRGTNSTASSNISAGYNQAQVPEVHEKAKQIVANEEKAKSDWDTFKANDTSSVVYSGKKGNVTQNMLDKWLNTDAQLSPEEKQLARDYYWSKAPANSIKQITSLFGSKEDKQKTNEERAELIELLPKFSGVGSAAHGFIQSADVGGVITKGLTALNDAIYGGDTQDSTKKAIENAKQYKSGATYTLGNAAGKMAQYYGVTKSGIMAPVSNAIGGVLGKHAGNILADEVVDVALDTIPEMFANIKSGMSGKDVAVQVAKNLGVNLAFNAGGEVIANIPAIKQAIMAKSGGKISEEAAEALAKNLDEISDNIAKNIPADEVKQIDSLKAVEQPEIETLAKQTENLPAQEIKAVETPNKNVAESVEVKPVEETVAKPIEEVAEPIEQEVKATADAVKETPIQKEVAQKAKTTPGTKTSKVYSNTLTKEGLVDMADEVNKRAAQYTPHHNADVLNDAVEDVAKNGDSLMHEYLTGSKHVATDGDVDRVMLLLHQQKDSIEEAIARGATDEELLPLKTKYEMLARRLRESETEGGRAIQALAKWNGTAEGAVQTGNKVLDAAGEKWAKKTKNKKTVKEIKSAADDLVGRTSGRLNTAISRIGNNGDVEKETVELTRKQIEERVLNSLKKHDLHQLTIKDEDVKFLSDMVENKEPVEIITDELEHRLKHGEWYPLDKSEPVKLDKNAKLQRVLESMGHKKQEVAKAVQKSPDQIKKEVINTLSDDYASVFGDMPDKDYNFVVQMLMDKRISNDLMRDEFEHYLKFGKFFEIDDSFFTKPAKEITNSRLDSVLKRIGQTQDDLAKATAQPKTYEQIREEVANSFAKESASAFDDITDTDIDYFATLVADPAVSRDVIQAQLEHRLKYGKYLNLDETIVQKQAQNRALNQIISDITGDGKTTVKEPLTPDEIRAQVKESLSKKLPDVKNFTDEDIDYVSNMLQNGAGSKDIAVALQSRIATGSWGVSNDTINQVNELAKEARQYLPGSKQRVETEQKMWDALAQDIFKNGGSLQEKYDAWRYAAMLGNIKTYNKNLLSTADMHLVTGFSNNLAAVMESAVNKARQKLGKEQFERTKAVINWANGSDRALVSDAYKDADNVWAALTGQSRWGKATNEIQKSKKAFKSKLANNIVELPGRALEGADNLFLKEKYSTSLAGYLKGNKASKDIFDAEYLLSIAKDKGYDGATIKNLQDQVDLLNRAREYAIDQAKYATFHADNDFAKAVTKLKENLNSSDSAGVRAIGKMVEGFIPYVKTPSNVLRNTFQFAPHRIINAFITAASKGDPVQAINEMAQGLTGVGLLYAGYKLADAGIVRGKVSDYEESKGLQNYSLNILGHNVSMADMVSGNAIFLVGVMLHDAFDKKGYDLKDFVDAANEKGFGEALKEVPWNETLNAASSIVEPIAETSMLTGVTNLINSVKYSDSPIPAVIGTLGGNYITQGVPTAAGQLARTIDPIRRSTYTDDSGAVGSVEKTFQKLENKLPFVSKTNEPYVDMWGREESNSPTDNPLLRAAYQFAFPSYMNKVETNNPVFNEIDRLLEVDGIEEKNVVPKDYNTTIGGQRMNQEDYTTYTKATGNARYQGVQAALNNADYQNLDDKTKATILNSIYSLASVIGKNEVTGNADSETDNVYKAYHNNGDSLDAAVDFLIKKETLKDDGLTLQSKPKIAQNLDGQGLSYDEINAWFKALNLGELTPEQYKKYTGKEVNQEIPQVEPQTQNNSFIDYLRSQGYGK